MGRYLFDQLAAKLPALQPGLAYTKIGGDTFDLEVAPAKMRVTYHAGDIVTFETKLAGPSGYFRIVEEPNGHLKFALHRMNPPTDIPMYIDEVPEHLAGLLRAYAVELREALDNPR